MGLTGNLETNTIGGMPYGYPGMGGFGGLGGFGLVGLLGLNSFLGHGHGHGHHDSGYHSHEERGVKDLLLMNAIGNLKDSVAEAKDSLADRVEGTKDALTSRMESTKDTLVREARDLDNEICDVKGKLLETKYDLAIQAERNTNEIKNQAQAFQIANDRKFDELSREGERNTALILAKLNQTEIDNLRDQLFTERRVRDGREIEISINNSNAQTQAQVQAQFQAQNDFLTRKFFDFDNQLNRTEQQIVNVGGTMAGIAQTANPTNVRT